jgi:hypothetical protein
LLINKVRWLGKNPNPFITNFLRRIVFFTHISSRVFPSSTSSQWQMLVVPTWTPVCKWRSEVAAPGPSAAPHNASPPPPPKIYSFFCIAGAQCREIQRVPLKFTKFMDGHELREAILHEQSGGGTPYEVEVWIL